jgi:hypothetical protein
VISLAGQAIHDGTPSHAVWLKLCIRSDAENAGQTRIDMSAAKIQSIRIRKNKGWLVF